MKTLLAIFCLFPCAFITAQKKILLYSKSELPSITIFLAEKAKANTPAAIVCPGGAYAYRSRDGGEGTGTCEKLQKNGITAILLDYRLPNGIDTIPLNDAQATITYLRNHANQFHIDPHQIGILGYSAGGHLASTAGTHWTSADNKPDFMVLAYPVISMADSVTHMWSRNNLLGKEATSEKIRLYSNELQVTDQTPPTFITHAMDDDGVSVNNSLLFYAALLQHHVPTEIFIYAKGGHAYSLNNKTTNVQWIDPCIDWIKTKSNKEQLNIRN